MSAAPSFSPPLAQLPVPGEHLSVQTKIDGMRSQTSLHSGEESIDEVQLGLDAHTDDLSMDEDRAQVDELEEDLNEGLHYPSGPPSSVQHVNGEHINGEVEPVQDPGVVDQAYKESDVTPALEQEVAMKEPIGELQQTAEQVEALVAEAEAMLQAEALGTVIITDDTGFVSLEEREIPEGEGFELIAPLTEQEISEISAMAQDFAREVEEMSTNPSERQSNDQDLNQPDLQSVESEPAVTPEPVVDAHEDIGAPPLRRMDEDTIPVTAHSKDSIIDILNDASGGMVDEGIQHATTTEPTLSESEAIAATEVIPELVDMEMDTQEAIHSEEPVSVSASVTTRTEYTHVQEPTKDVEGDHIIVEQDRVIVEQAEELSDTTAEVNIDQQPVQIIQEEPNSAVQGESAMPIPMVDDAIITSDESAGPIVAVVEQSTMDVEQTSVEQSEQFKPPIIDPAPETTMETAATSVEITIPTNPVVANSAISTATTGDMEMDHIERAVQIQLEQDATAQTTGDETQATLVDESTASANNTIVTDQIADPTAPKDSDSPLRRAASRSQPQSQPDPVIPETAGPTDPLVTQRGETGNPEENLEAPKLQELQSRVSPDQPEIVPTAEPVNRQSPEWEGFAALDEDVRGSPEPEPSSEPSEFPDATEDSPLDPTEKPASASTDNEKEPSNSFAAPAPSRKKKKPKIIMEVVIPVAPSKPKVVQGTKTTKRHPRGRPPKSTKAPSKSEPSSSSPPQSPSAGTPVKSEASESEPEPEPEPVPQMKRSIGKRSRPSGSNKRTKKAVASGSSTRPVHVAHAAKLEVVIPRRPRPSVLKRAGSASTGNNVKFAPAPSVTGKRKAESEPEADEEGSDADADGETDDGYEDVEEEPKVEVEVVISPRKARKKTQAGKIKTSPVKRPRRSNDARKTPTKLPSLVSKASRPSPKRRRLRR